MCGIAGYIGTKRASDDHVAACLRSLQHRGPDGSGIYRHEIHGRHCLLLHTRLAIIDLDERAAQPMRCASKILACNGEVYNYLELRDNLEQRGEHFATTSDTEVLLRALTLDGDSALDKLEGMWAFALYNESTGILTLCRDRFGEKPLHLFQTDHGLFFASEVKALVALSGRQLKPNMTQIKRHLVNGYKSLYKGTETFYQNVKQLPSGHVLRTEGNQTTVASYWDRTRKIEQGMSYQEAVQGTRERLIRSMELRLRSDVPLAFCMSGGVDSNTLISIARRVFDHEVHGFTVVNSDQRYDEWDLVQGAIKELNVRHTPIPVETGDFLGNLRNLVRQHDGPVATISYYAHWLLMKAVSEAGYKVSISGTAADELFTGYYDHHSMYLAMVHGTEDFAPALANWNAHIKPIVRNPLLQDPEAFVKRPEQREHIYLDADLYASMLTQTFNEPFKESPLHPELLRKRMLNELFHESVPVILNEDDLNAMSLSIENRSPFLDRALFDFAYSIPTRHLIQDGYNKRILREAMRGIVPDPIVDCRRKVGFNAPLFDFLDRSNKNVQAEVLEDSPLFEVVSHASVTELLHKKHLSNADSKFLFNILNIKYFLEGLAA